MEFQGLIKASGMLRAVLGQVSHDPETENRMLRSIEQLQKDLAGFAVIADAGTAEESDGIIL